ncbi:hypothetical protein FA13DRAFT_298666 [Coprinellus micaceus]|uniref:Secreted protein n=1 Tax=Coprinellus micaceus TaxID=71717 RepID=A0A4Y7SDQ3_COPMI|nr:hypothetical protein FA13DRAFT_298666 [Coprinellus micaceus]
MLLTTWAAVVFRLTCVFRGSSSSRETKKAHLHQSLKRSGRLSCGYWARIVVSAPWLPARRALSQFNSVLARCYNWRQYSATLLDCKLMLGPRTPRGSSPRRSLRSKFSLIDHAQSSTPSVYL